MTKLASALSTQVSISKQKLNLGCGRDIRPSSKKERWVNLDTVALTGVDVVHDLTEFPWPLADNSFDEIVAYDILEHLPDTVKTMEEIWRILKPGGVVEIQVPYWNSMEMITDPTHKRFFNEHTFEFFDINSKRHQKRSYYTSARFEREALEIKMVALHFGFHLQEGVGQRFILWLSKRIGNVTRNLKIRLRAIKDTTGVR